MKIISHAAPFEFQEGGLGIDNETESFESLKLALSSPPLIPPREARHLLQVESSIRSIRIVL
jgi:hypothetical protein